MKSKLSSCQIVEDYLTGISKGAIIGNSIRIEASSICQLKCPACSTGNGRMGVAGKGYLKSRDFKKFVDDYPGIKNIELSNYGEIFLNPELMNIIKYAYSKNISLNANNGVNLNTISQELIECLVKYRFKSLTISIDGATNTIYQIYRVGGNLDTVINNIKRINNFKKKYKTGLPELRWQFILFGHNEHQLPAARKIAKELGMDFKVKLNHSPAYSPVKNKKLIKRASGTGGIVSIKIYKRRIAAEGTCCQLWISPQINWDGKLLGCCVNKWGDFGNVFKSGLKKCLESEKYLYAKKMVLGQVKARKDIPCSHCPYYKKKQS